MSELAPAGVTGVCQVCGDPMESEVVRCERCDTPHHGACWEYIQGCSTFACPAVAPQRADEEVETRLDPGQYVIPGALAVRNAVASYTAAGDRAFQVPLAAVGVLTTAHHRPRMVGVFLGALALPVRDATGALHAVLGGGPGFRALRIRCRAEFRLLLAHLPATKVRTAQARLRLEALIPSDDEDYEGSIRVDLMPPIAVSGAKEPGEGERRAMNALHTVARTAATHLRLAFLEQPAGV